MIFVNVIGDSEENRNGRHNYGWVGYTNMRANGYNNGGASERRHRYIASRIVKQRRKPMSESERNGRAGIMTQEQRQVEPTVGQRL